MHTDAQITIPCSLSDEELMAAVSRLARCEHETTASLIAHLAELEARRLYLGAGCPSLFVYCTDVLRLSEHEAYNRMEAARLGRKFPVVLQMLAAGALSLTTARLLSPHLSAENHEDLLSAAAGKGKREVAVLLARRFPLPDVPPSIRKVPAPRPMTASLEGTITAAPEATRSTAAAVAPVEGAGLAGPKGPSALPVPAASESARRRDLVRPLAADRYEFRFTASAATREKLRLATDLLRHAVPNGDTGEIVDRALTALIAELAKKKFAAAARPGPSRNGAPGNRHGGAGNRHIPAHVKRAVWLRDGGRCAFVGNGTRRCRERGFLEFHHVRPFGAGGEATVENIGLRCRAHNAYESEWFYGRRFVPGMEPEAGLELAPERVGAFRRSGPSPEEKPGGPPPTKG